MIVKKEKAERLLGRQLRGRKSQFYVLSEKQPHKNLGGPYNYRDAFCRLQQVEYFKHR